MGGLLIFGLPLIAGAVGTATPTVSFEVTMSGTVAAHQPVVTSTNSPVEAEAAAKKPSFRWASHDADSSRYGLHVAYDPDRHLLGGVQHVQWRNPTGRQATEVQMVLRANLDAAPNPNLSSVANAAGYARGFDASWTKIKAVTAPDGSALQWRLAPGPATFQTFNLADNLLIVTLPRPVGAGRHARFTIEFETKVPHRQGDQGTINGEVTWRFGWFPQERRWDRAAGAWATGDTLEAFRFDLIVEVPQRLRIVIGGDTYVETLQGELRIGHATSDVPVRSIPLFLHDSYRQFTEDFGSLEVTVVYNPDFALLDSSAGEANRVFDWIEAILNHYEPRYGPYRSRRLVVVESPTTGLSMAADGMVLLGDAFWIYDRTILAWGIYTPIAEATLAHELAHLWWGVGVGVDFTTDNWLSEAFAQYLSLTYMADKEGRTADGFRPNWFVRWLLGSSSETKLPRRQVEETIIPSYRAHVRSGIDGAIGKPVDEQAHLEALTMLWYQKGYLAVKALEAAMPRAKVEAVLRRMQREYAGDVATIGDLKRVAEDESGVDLGVFFDGWVYGTAQADFAVEDVRRSRIKGGYETEVHLRRLGQPGLPVEVLALDRRGKETRASWDGLEQTGVVTLETRRPVVQVEVDPENTSMDFNRYDNHHPRRTSFSLLMARNDPDAYGLTLKPTRASSFGVAGPALGGNYLDDHQWWVGGGLGSAVRSEDESAAPSDDMATALDNVSIGGAAYIESQWNLDRYHSFFVGAAVRAGTRAEGSVDGVLRAGYQTAIYDAPELGLVAPLELPQTQLAIFAGPRILSDDARDGAELAAEVTLSVLRDDSLKLGMVNTLSLSGGISDALDPYVLGRWDLIEVVSLGVVGALDARLALGVATPGTPDELRFTADLSPASLVRGSEDGQLRMGQVALTYHLPLLQQLRIKNLLTLHLFVLNGVDLDLHYVAGYLDDGPARPLDVDRLFGELGGGGTLHLALFDGVNIGLAMGWTFPFVPSTIDVTGGRFYLTLRLSPFAL